MAPNVALLKIQIFNIQFFGKYECSLNESSQAISNGKEGNKGVHRVRGHDNYMKNPKIL